MFKNKKTAIKTLLLTALFTLPAAYAQAQVKFLPVANASLLGGKYYLDSDAASFQGRFDAFFSPTMQLGEGHDLIPVYAMNYSGTQDIQELAGGDVLTRKRQTHTFSLKYVYTSDFNKYKPRFSYSKALINETKDEDWGDGLFDYATLSAGIDAEQERPHGTFTESYDFYKVSYPNYSSLLSQSGTVIDTTTFNELSANAGTDTMDNTNHRFGFGYSWFPEPLTMQAGYDFTYRRYGDQSVVGSLGSFKSDKRYDLAQNWSIKASRAAKPVYLSAKARVGWLSSNQNSYDSSRTKYIDDFYSYVDVSVSPAATLALKNGTQFSFGLDWRRLYYLNRLSQDVSGNYTTSKIRQTFWLTSVSARYPVFAGFFARAAYNYQVSSANMRYEDNYRYNYRASTYLLGLEWEF